MPKPSQTNPEASIIGDLGLDVKILRLRMALAEELQESSDRLNIEEQVGSFEVADKFQSVHTEINLMAGFMNQVSYAF